MKNWEIIADNLSKAVWSWGCVSALDSNGRTIWIADAYRGDGKRFAVRADEMLTALLELDSAVQRPKTEYGTAGGVGLRLTDQGAIDHRRDSW